MKRTVALVLTGALLVGGCASYYKVTDASNGKAYYTEEVKRNGSAVEFKDGKTGAVTTLQDSQVLEISKQQYESEIGQK